MSRVKDLMFENESLKLQVKILKKKLVESKLQIEELLSQDISLKF